MNALPDVSSSVFVSQTSAVDELTKLVTQLEQTKLYEDFDSPAAAAQPETAPPVTWRLRATTPLYSPRLPSFLRPSPPPFSSSIEVYQRILPSGGAGGGKRVDNVIYVPPKAFPALVEDGVKVTLIHDCEERRPLSYLTLRSCVVSRVPPSAPLFAAVGKPDEGEGEAETARVEDVLGLNVPVAPHFLSAAGDTGFETTWEDEQLRITRGGSGVGGVWGGFRVFEKI